MGKLIVLLAMLAVALWPAALLAQQTEPVTLNVDGRTAEVHRQGNSMVITSGDQRWTVTYYGRGSTGTSGPIGDWGDVHFLDRALEEWEAQGGVLPFSEPVREAEPVLILFGLVFIGLGLMGLIVPYAAWWLSIGWSLKNAEPSDIALVLHRLGGGLTGAVGVVLLVNGL